MDADTPRREEDLSEVERHLAGWKPDAGNLDADAMLFDAGRAAGGGGRGALLWPALCAFLAAQAAGLGVWGLSERTERLALAGRLRDGTPAANVPAAPAVVVLPESSYTPLPDDYFHLRRRAEQDPGRWLASSRSERTQPPGPPPPSPAIFSAGQRDGLPDR
jgi:hypothetical protein